MLKSRKKHDRSSDFDISIIPYSEVPTKSTAKPSHNGTKRVRRKETEEPQITPIRTSASPANEDLKHQRDFRQRTASNHSDRRQKTNTVIGPVENGRPDAIGREHPTTVVDSVTAYRYLSEGNTRRKSRSRRLFSSCFSCRCFRR